MFAYNPTVNDQSGQIIGESVVNAANTSANANMQLASDIGGALTSLAGAYGASKMKAAGGKAFKDFMGVAGPAMGLKDEQLKLFKTMSDQDAYQMSEMFMPVAPSMVSAAGLGSYQNRLALANQTAANQSALRQPAPNQVPMGAGNPPPANDTTTPSTPVFGAGIQTRRVY